MDGNQDFCNISWCYDAWPHNPTELPHCCAESTVLHIIQKRPVYFLEEAKIITSRHVAATRRQKPDPKLAEPVVSPLIHTAETSLGNKISLDIPFMEGVAMGRGRGGEEATGPLWGLKWGPCIISHILAVTSQFWRLMFLFWGCLPISGISIVDTIHFQFNVAGIL